MTSHNEVNQNGDEWVIKIVDEYVKKVKKLYEMEPDIYKKFRRVLDRYTQGRCSVENFKRRVSQLFKKHRGLIEECETLLYLYTPPNSPPSSPKNSLNKTEECNNITQSVEDFDLNAVQLSDFSQTVEEKLPLKQAEKSVEIPGNLLFQQIDSIKMTQIPNLLHYSLRCLFCKYKFVIPYLADLINHYKSSHQLTVDTNTTKFHENFLYVCVHDNLNEETTVISNCCLCETALRNIEEVKYHYTNTHNVTVKLVPMVDIPDIENKKYFICNFCNYSSLNIAEHHLHLKVIHNLQFYVCPHCNHFTPRVNFLERHIILKHSQKQLSSPLKVEFYLQDDKTRLQDGSLLQDESYLQNKQPDFQIKHCLQEERPRFQDKQPALQDEEYCLYDEKHRFHDKELCLHDEECRFLDEESCLQNRSRLQHKKIRLKYKDTSLRDRVVPEQNNEHPVRNDQHPLRNEQSGERDADSTEGVDLPPVMDEQPPVSDKPLPVPDAPQPVPDEPLLMPDEPLPLPDEQLPGPEEELPGPEEELPGPEEQLPGPDNKHLAGDEPHLRTSNAFTSLSSLSRNSLLARRISLKIWILLNKWNLSSRLVSLARWTSITILISLTIWTLLTKWN